MSKFWNIIDSQAKSWAFSFHFPLNSGVASNDKHFLISVHKGNPKDINNGIAMQDTSTPVIIPQLVEQHSHRK